MCFEDVHGISTTARAQARGFLLEELAAWRPEALGVKPRNVGLLQRQDLASSAAVLDVIENRCLFELMADLLVRSTPPQRPAVWKGRRHAVPAQHAPGAVFLQCTKRRLCAVQGGEVVTAGYKWLRAVGDQEFTGAHMDRVFVGGAARMLTAWIPLGDVPVEQGSLLVRCLLLSMSAPVTM